jgi:hypothetical protein
MCLEQEKKYTGLTVLTLKNLPVTLHFRIYGLQEDPGLQYIGKD